MTSTIEHGESKCDALLGRLRTVQNERDVSRLNRHFGMIREEGACVSVGTHSQQNHVKLGVAVFHREFTQFFFILIGYVLC